MSFRIRGSDSILQRLTTWVATNTKKITDFNPGSAIRTLLEAASLQIEEFYYDLKQAVQFAIKNSGYHAFGFEKYKAVKASGNVVILFEKVLTDSLLIQKGTEFNTGNRRSKKIYYKSTENVIIRAGVQSGIIPVECTEAGEIGNVSAGEINKMNPSNPHIASISNVNAFVNGKDIETDIQREMRFKEYVHSLQRGTAEAVAYGIKQVNGVSGVWIDDSYIGYMYAYVHDKNGDLTEELKKKVEQAVVDYRSGGIEVVIRPVVKKLVDIEFKIFYKPRVNTTLYDELIENLVSGYINQLNVAEDLNMSNVITTINDTYRDVIAYIDIMDSKDIKTVTNEIIRSENVILHSEIINGGI